LPLPLLLRVVIANYIHYMTYIIFLKPMNGISQFDALKQFQCNQSTRHLSQDVGHQIAG
jgi:hypothetical protein